MKLGAIAEWTRWKYQGHLGFSSEMKRLNSSFECTRSNVAVTLVVVAL